MQASEDHPTPGERNEEVATHAEQTGTGPAPVAIVGTLAEFRPEPVPYDLGELVRFVETIGPDLLCLDMSLDQWLRRDFGGLPPEYRDALLPLAAQTDVVVVPIGDGVEAANLGEEQDATPARVRGWLYRRLRSMVGRLQQGIDSPVAVGEGLRHLLAEHLLDVADRLERSPARKTAAAHRDALVERIAELARRDPGRRILVVVNVRYCHQLRNALHAHPEVAVVRHSDL